MDLHRLIPAAARVVELAGVAMLLLGALLALGVFVAHVARGRPFAAVYDDLRANLGRAILLGLEFLVIADIIGTVAVEPTLANLAVLAVIVAIRTFLSFALELEVTGRWPWQSRAAGRPDAEQTGESSRR